MSRVSLWASRSTTLLVLGLAATPILISQTAMAASFVDIQGHWARPFIEALASQNIISGYSDRTFRPDQPVTRAQFTAMLSQAFNENNLQLPQPFDRASADYWSSRDFTRGQSSARQLRASDSLSKVQVLVSLVNGLGLEPSDSAANILTFYKDAASIPEYARDGVAAATQKGMVVNYPDVTFFNPSKTATRADVAAFIYQALVNVGVLAPISSRVQASNYIVRLTPGNNGISNNPSNNQTISNNLNTPTVQYKVSRGTSIQVAYPNSGRLAVAPGETVNITLMVAEDIKNSRGEILIPKDSKIEGQIVPRYSGSSFLGAQFVAQRLMIGDEVYNSINATSSLVTGQPPDNTKQPTLGDAAVSILTGVLTGRSSNQQPQNTSIIIDPAKDLPLTLGSDFYVNRIIQAQNQ